MSYVSLSSALRSSRVGAGIAPGGQSARFLKTCDLSCPLRENRDVYGREVCINTLNTKTQGCDTAEDRILAENALRPNLYDFLDYNPWEERNAVISAPCEGNLCAALGAGIDIGKNIRVSQTFE